MGSHSYQDPSLSEGGNGCGAMLACVPIGLGLLAILALVVVPLVAGHPISIR